MRAQYIHNSTYILYRIEGNQIMMLYLHMWLKYVYLLVKPAEIDSQCDINAIIPNHSSADDT